MKKHSVKKIVGWILVVIQIFGIIGRMMSGEPFPSGISGFFNLIGFLLFGIVGVILLVLAYKDKE